MAKVYLNAKGFADRDVHLLASVRFPNKRFLTFFSHRSMYTRDAIVITRFIVYQFAADDESRKRAAKFALAFQVAI